MKNFFHNLRPKTAFSFSAFAAIFGVAALVGFAVFLLGRVRNESAEIEAAKIRRASMEMRRNEAQREESSLAELHREIARVEGAFIGHPLVFFEFLEDLASRNNLAISLSLAEGNSAERSERLYITVSGIYRNLLRFVRGIESAPYETDVRGIAVQIANQRSLFSDSLARFAVDLNIISR